MSEQQPPPCTACSGTGGHTVDTSNNGVVRQNWKSCQSCSGTGTAGGSH